MQEASRRQFAEDGYFVVPEALGREACADLLREIIEAFHSSKPTVIKEPAYRRHAPLALTDCVGDALTTTLEHGHELLSGFLENQQELVELSSITVFPNAAEQPLHRDEANAGHFLVSVFINLAETREDAGALQVMPGSHDLTAGGGGAPIALELPPGSAVFMNSKLLHGGGANSTADRMRSVFYFTMGETGLYGPPYSILPEVAAQHLRLDELRPGDGQRRLGWDLESRPQLSPDCQILLPLSSEESGEELLLCQRGTVRRRMVLSPEEEYLLDVLQSIECHPRELELRDLASRHEVHPDTLVSRCAVLARDGWIRR